MKNRLNMGGKVSTGLVFLAAVSFARLSDANVIHACYQKDHGQLRVVSSPDQCLASETPISWNEVGPQGPIGLTGPAGPGVCVPDAAASPRFEDNGDGTITDHQTCLMWEQKTGTVGGAVDYSNPHNVNNSYTWSVSGMAADGSAFTDFLARINGTLCDEFTCTGLGGHVDWRLPTSAELQTILLKPYFCDTHPCIDPAFGPTQGSYYWSSTTAGWNPSVARIVDFIFGYLGSGDGKTDVRGNYVRAVRGGF